MPLISTNRTYVIFPWVLPLTLLLVSFGDLDSMIWITRHSQDPPPQLWYCVSGYIHYADDIIEEKVTGTKESSQPHNTKIKPWHSAQCDTGTLWGIAEIAYLLDSFRKRQFFSPTLQQAYLLNFNTNTVAALSPAQRKSQGQWLGWPPFYSLVLSTAANCPWISDEVHPEHLRNKRGET